MHFSFFATLTHALTSQNYMFWVLGGLGLQRWSSRNGFFAFFATSHNFWFPEMHFCIFLATLAHFLAPVLLFVLSFKGFWKPQTNRDHPHTTEIKHCPLPWVTPHKFGTHARRDRTQPQREQHRQLKWTCCSLCVWQHQSLIINILVIKKTRPPIMVTTWLFDVEVMFPLWPVSHHQYINTKKREKPTTEEAAFPLQLTMLLPLWVASVSFYHYYCNDVRQVPPHTKGGRNSTPTGNVAPSVVVLCRAEHGYRICVEWLFGLGLRWFFRLCGACGSQCS